MVKEFTLVILATALTALCWGVYGPVLHWGQQGMGGARLKPFVCVGVAYFLIAVVVPMVMLYVMGTESESKFGWTRTGVIWSLAGGAVGAVGALGIIMAFNFGGKPSFVMPLVFGCAPVINTLFTAYFNKSLKDISPFYAAGMILVLVGAVTVLIFQPKSSKPGTHGQAPAVKSTSAPAKV